MQETQVQFLGQEDPWSKKQQSVPIFSCKKFHGQRSLAGCGPWSCKEPDKTEQLTTHTHTLMHTHTLTLSLSPIKETEVNVKDSVYNPSI